MSKNHPFTRLWHSPPVRGTRHFFSIRRWHRHATANDRQLPDFIVAGAQKSGTTSLYGYLSEHPQVVPPVSKETSFFDNHFHRGMRWYRAHFPHSSEMQSATANAPMLTGESTAHYMFHPHAPRRIAEDLPNVKIILLLRDPVDRAYSHYQLNIRRGNETLPFEEAIDAEPARLHGQRNRMLIFENHYSFAHEKYSYLARGRYAELLPAWHTFFPPDRLLVVESGQLFKQPAVVYGQVLDFLGLETWQPEQFGNRFPGRYSEPISQDMRDRLTTYFAPHNEQLFALLGQRYPWQLPAAKRKAA